MEDNKKLTLREWFKWLNATEEDVDIYVDGIDGIAVCAPFHLTEAGEEHFKRALDECWIEDNTIMWEEDGSEQDDEDGLPDVAYLAYELLCTQAGYVSVAEFDKWVKK